MQNLSFTKIQDICQDFRTTLKISGHSGQTLKFQEFHKIQDNAQA